MCWEQASLVDEFRRTAVHARAYWLVGPAHHVYDDHQDCVSTAAGAPSHRMSFHRSMLFSAIGAEALKTVVPLVDMWRLTADQASRCAKIHYDTLYVPEGDGGVSRAVANLLLNACCNPRLLPAEMLWHGLADLDGAGGGHSSGRRAP